MAISGLDQRWFAGCRIDGKHRNGVLATVGYLLAVELHRAPGTIRDVNNVAARVNMDGRGQLRDVTAIVVERGPLDIAGLSRKRVVQPVVHVQLVLPFDRQVDPRLSGMKIKMARSITKAALAADL